MRRLVLATGIATFVLIIVGGVVRVSDSGLGCGPAGSGFHGWPFCNGDVVPGVNLHSIVEYTHRAVAGIVTILIVSIVVQAWRRHRRGGHLAADVLHRLNAAHTRDDVEVVGRRRRAGEPLERVALPGVGAGQDVAAAQRPAVDARAARTAAQSGVGNAHDPAEHDQQESGGKGG
jgi:hypothetical protein